MNTKRIADLLGVTTNTIRRWCETYTDFLSPVATPAKGQARVLTEQDQRVLRYVAALREEGQTPEAVAGRLRELQADGWKHLPALPVEWGSPDLMPVPIAAAKAHDLAQLAVLQNELAHFRAKLQLAEDTRVRLEEELASERDVRGGLQTRLHEAELEAERLRGQVATLEAHLQSYKSLTGGRPLNLLIVLGVVALTTAVLIISAIAITSIL